LYQRFQRHGMLVIIFIYFNIGGSATKFKKTVYNLIFSGSATKFKKTVYNLIFSRSLRTYAILFI
jgi:hypothetical protein